MQTIVLLSVLSALASPADEKAAPHGRGLSITFVDVEGGAATLIVTPARESILIDSGFPGERDAGRIAKAARSAGLDHIDHFLLTHWHLDHVGGVPALSKLIPIEHFHDRGLPPMPNDGGTTLASVDEYAKATGGRSESLKPGEALHLKQTASAPAVSFRCLVARSEIEGGAGPVGPTPCKDHPAQPIDTTDNVKSAGFLLRFGEFDFLDLGDLTWNVEHALVCPKNRIGEVDVYQVSHHGAESSNHPALLKAVAPRVAVINNGPRKGGSKEVFARLKAVKSIEAVFQIHRNVATGDEDNAPAEAIANIPEACQGEPVSIEVAPDGKSYEVQVGSAGGRRRFASR